MLNKFYKRIKIRSFLTVVILLGILLPLTFATILAFSFTQITIRNHYTEEYISSIFSEIENNISLVSSRLNALSLQISSSPDIAKIIRSSEINYPEKYKRLSDTFHNIFKDNSLIEFVSIITPDGENFCFSSASHTTPLQPELKYINNLSRTQLSFYCDAIKINNNYYCAISKSLYNYNTSNQVGNIVFFVKANLLGSLHTVSDFNESIFFITNNGKIISHTNEDYINSLLYFPFEFMENNRYNKYFSTQKNGYAFYEYTLHNNALVDSLQVNALISNYTLHSTALSIIRYITITYIITILLALLAAIILPRKLLSRITNLKAQMEQYHNNYKMAYPITPSNEIASLEISFNNMIKEIRNLISTIEEEKELQKIAELNALQSQINPHFIYNAIDAISWKAKENQQYEIDDMLITLATFFRIGLHKGAHLITISDELLHVKSYLDIESKRFPDLFSVFYDIDPDILHCKILKITLQPIVENCIKHGFHNLSSPGRIQIRIISAGEERILFEVSDNGIGISLNKDELPTSSNPMGGYGLYNVNERLKKYYGSDYSLQIQSSPGKGTTVRGYIRRELS